MNVETVNNRLSLVGTSSGSIISVATWCALHAQDADVVIPALCAKLTAPSTSDVVRASLMYVLHELLLTCASSGTAESAKRVVLLAVARTLPASLETVWQRAATAGNGCGAFHAAVGKVLVWWGMLNLFPRQWLDELRKKHRKAQEACGLDPVLAATLQRAITLLSRYQDAKEQWVRAKERRQATGEPLDAGAEEAARRALTTLRKAVDGKLEGNRSLGAWCAAQQAELDGQQYTGSEKYAKREGNADATSAAVKTEGNATSEPVAEEDDILGSFY